jgi:5-(carboxyamino)imidazole ribonucleotide mutase
MANPVVGIIMGSDSDFDVMKKPAEKLSEFSIETEVKVVSAHRTPDEMADYAKSAKSRRIKVIIAGAGGSAHLPGMTAAYTELPVVAVPVVRQSHSDAAIKSSNAMPPGVPLAVMPANGAVNAALFAVAILALSDDEVAQRLSEYRQNMHDQVVETASKLEELGWESYFEQN